MIQCSTIILSQYPLVLVNYHFIISIFAMTGELKHHMH